MVKRRSPFISVLSNIASTGLGHLYCGRPVRGILFFALVVASALSAAVFYQLTHRFWVLAILFLGCILLFIAALADVFVIARHSRDYEIKWFNRWYLYLLYVGCAFLVSELAGNIWEDFIKPYKTPSSAMEPTLRIGDYYIVDRRIYKNNEPSRGDVVVFAFPKDTSILFFKRIVGLPGDTIEIKEKILYVNGKKVNEPYVIYMGDETGEIKTIDDFGPVTVPPNSFFTLGDNRDRSFDSRYWGFVSREHLKGKALHVYFSRDVDGTIHWTRIGYKIE
jgi:signal peptidase I